MGTELDVIDSLTAIGYSGPCMENETLCSALQGGFKSEHFRDLVVWLTNELHVLRKTDENVNKDSEANEFAMELAMMLKELGCPFQTFVAGPLSGRFSTKESRLQLLEYLIVELMGTRMHLKHKPAQSKELVISKLETNTARALEVISNDLGLEKAPGNIAARAIMNKVTFKLEEFKRNDKSGFISQPLLSTAKQLSKVQWKKLEDIQKSLDEEYNLRRQMLLTRLEVTIQSFQWSEKMRGKEDIINQKYQERMRELEKNRFGDKDTDIIALLAARSDLAIIEKTSSANVRKNTFTKIHKHVIGYVPDRGGRAHEHAPPPPEMPSWQTQRAPGPAGGGGRGGFGGGGFRGGRGGHQQQPYQGGGQNFGSNNYQQHNQGNNYQHQNQGNNFQQPNQGNYHSSNQGNNWMSGSGRVQGSGWQKQGGGSGTGQHDQSNNYNNSYNDNRAQRGGGNGRNYSNNSDSYGNQQQGGGRGRSNYRRGGYRN